MIVLWLTLEIFKIEYVLVHDNSSNPNRISYINTNRSQELDIHLSTVTNEIVNHCENIPSNSFHRNISVQELKALTDLKSFQDIVIKVSDKCSAVVVMDRARYIRGFASLRGCEDLCTPRL